MQALRKYAADRPDIARAMRMISADEDNHLAYCHEELLQLAAGGHAAFIRSALRAAALAEIAIYRDVSTAVMAHLGKILGWSRSKAAVLAAGIRAVYALRAARRLAASGVAAHADPAQRGGRPGTSAPQMRIEQLTPLNVRCPAAAPMRRPARVAAGRVAARPGRTARDSRARRTTR